VIALLADHLWQSTLFALAAGLLTLAFRRHGAGVRYGLWFAASLKFLIPFALLAAAGEALAKRLHLTLMAPPEAAAVGQAARPLAWAPELMAPATSFGTAPPSAPAAQAVHAMTFGADRAPALLAAIWALGLCALAMVWAVRWSKVRAAVRDAAPVDLALPIPVRSTPSGLEPGVVGLWRPVLLLPEGVTEQLSPAELDAVIAHELRHVRRKDNLTGAIHMLVQALFWFHPLVWWLGERLIAERERACDEAVLRAGHDRETYARGIIETCRIYLQAPLTCVAGASGSKLAMRVDDILSRPLSQPLPLEARASIGLAGLLALTVPVGAGLLKAPDIVQPLIAKPLAVLAQAAHVAPLFQPPAPRTSEVWAVQGTVTPPVERTGPAASAAAPAPASPATETQAVAAPAPEAPADAAPARPEGFIAWPHEPPRVQLRPVPATEVSLVSPAAVENATPAEIRRQTYLFAETFGATTVKLDQFARWTQPVCVTVQGLPAQATAQVKGRVEDVAGALKIGVMKAGCRPNIQILFTGQPQALMDRVAERQELLLGYWHRRDRDKLKAVTRPIQAWYVTGVESGGGDPVIGAAVGPFLAGSATVGVPPHGRLLDDEDNVGWGPTGCGDNPHFNTCLASEFEHVLVVVDTNRAGNVTAGLIADYVAMIAMAQPKSLDGCSGLPSVIDLFSACPGRSSGPAGLTRADAAYLTALYKTDLQAKKAAQVTDIASRMADMLIGDRRMQMADAKTGASLTTK
jgi:beta-lactamase regulating signal transducer with metallopeptidase domain